MAASMAQELYEAIEGEPYVEFPSKLDADVGVDWKQLPAICKIFNKSDDVSGGSDIQVTRFFTRQHKLKLSGMFEMFGVYTGENPDKIRENLVKHVYENRKQVENTVKNCLPTGVSLGNWLLKITHKSNPGDELALFLLC